MKDGVATWESLESASDRTSETTASPVGSVKQISEKINSIESPAGVGAYGTGKALVV